MPTLIRYNPLKVCTGACIREKCAGMTSRQAVPDRVLSCDPDTVTFLRRTAQGNGNFRFHSITPCTARRADA